MEKSNNYTYEFSTPRSKTEVWNLLLNPTNWWTGVYNEDIQGQSKQSGDEFSFAAGEGAHFTRQRLIENIPGTSVEWQVVESNLSFLEHPDEWEGTSFRFDLDQRNGETVVRFTHAGLTPQIECYDACSTGWTSYLSKLEASLK